MKNPKRENRLFKKQMDKEKEMKLKEIKFHKKRSTKKQNVHNFEYEII